MCISLWHLSGFLAISLELWNTALDLCMQGEEAWHINVQTEHRLPEFTFTGIVEIQKHMHKTTRNTNHLPSEAGTEQVLDDLNLHIHECNRKLVAQECVTPFQHDAVEIDHLVQQIDPKLWNAASMLTRSVSERRGKSASKNTASAVSHVKKIRRLFTLCTLLFCTDDRCSVPLHTLTADIVDSLGGSSLLLRDTESIGSMCILWHPISLHPTQDPIKANGWNWTWSRLTRVYRCFSI